ncbi:TetR/AcrR family transcriptional regulator [Homoserinibacter sp. GY 40078]|uniref:TetR/AcrR family transcriptional regulator n=1 Tax=Homoserinibacter sp. GY 40078 TaxID=2603275 RepID=UPI00164F9C59|nr:TetR/AcrR family transcriptional regulator [Homoserinibacter sp. GY 40078]
MKSEASASPTRMRSEDRRALILEAATAVFGEHGYHGATTDQIARAAGVSQPYVVRMFGGKEAMFLEVLDRTLQRIIASFDAAVEENRASGAEGEEALAHCIGRNYADLLSDRGLLLSLMQAFMLGADPVVGPHARAGFLRVYRYLREVVGLDATAANDFLAYGMFLNTIVGVRMVDDYENDSSAREMLDEILPTKLELLMTDRSSAS